MRTGSGLQFGHSWTGTTERRVCGRSFWHDVQHRDSFVDAFAKARLTLDYRPNELGKEVESITFWSAAPIVWM